MSKEAADAKNEGGAEAHEGEQSSVVEIYSDDQNPPPLVMVHPASSRPATSGLPAPVGVTVFADCRAASTGRFPKNSVVPLPTRPAMASASAMAIIPDNSAAGDEMRAEVRSWVGNGY